MAELSKNQIIDFLHTGKEQQQELFAEASRVRNQYLGKEVLIRGVIEVTNLCRVNCDYCPMRRDNTKTNQTYVMSPEEVIDAARIVRDNKIDVVFFQGGEIPQTTKLLGKIIPEVRDLFDDEVEVLLCLGNKTFDEYQYLWDQGATSYILKHETSDPLVHERSRESPLKERLQCLENLLKIGYKVGTGNIVGLPGQTINSLADDILLAVEMGVDMVSASPLIPAPNTPFAQLSAGSVDLTLNTMAILRIMKPNLLIPSVSALEKLMHGGQLAGLRAGANVVTINFTPERNKSKYLIYGEERYVVGTKHVSQLLTAADLTARGSFWT